MKRNRKSSVTQNHHCKFETAVTSVPDTNSIMNLVRMPIDLQNHLCRTTTIRERKTIKNWEIFDLEINDIDRLYHITRQKNDDYCTYFELMVRIKKNGICNNSNEYLYSYLYAEHDNRFFSNINGFIFITKKIELLLAIIIQERPRKIYSCQVISPYTNGRVFNSVCIYNYSDKFNNLLIDKEDGRIIREFSIELPILENVKQILNLLKKDGIDVDPAFIDKKLLKKKSKKFQKKIEKEKNYYYYYLGSIGTEWDMKKEDCNDEALLQTLYCKPFIFDKDYYYKKIMDYNYYYYK